MCTATCLTDSGDHSAAGVTMLGGVVASLGVGLAASVMLVYDVLTLPIYTLLQQPWVQIKKAKKIRVSARRLVPASRRDRPLYVLWHGAGPNGGGRC